MEYSRLSPDIVQNAATVLKCVAHPLRLRIIEALEENDRAVGDLVELLAAPQAVVSKHLGCLRRAGLVDCRKEINYRYYFIRNRNILSILECIRKTCGKEG